VPVEIKFCGLTRPEDAAAAAALGASYAGAIFAGGPRHVSPEQAATIFADLPPRVRRVGVFAEQDAAEIAAAAATASLDVVQLHGNWSDARIAELRLVFRGAIWPVVRVSAPVETAQLAAAASAGDAVLVDAFVPGRLGGTGQPLPWDALAQALRAIGSGRPLILAGGLRPENVAGAIKILSPHVVDVSSGVESAPGIKDREKMKAFRDAVAGASTPR
jgi:phosphoribosylanthranilate isomerase